MLADMQRARALAWELPALGWDVEILTPAAVEVRQDAIEPNGDGFFAADTPVHEVHTWFPVLFRLLSLQSGPWRWWLPMFWRGRALLASGRFDLIYFSTTCFNLVTLGRVWKREFGVPYVIDFQDPWALPNYGFPRTGWKARLSARLDPIMEKTAVLNAAGIVAVSDSYIAMLTKQYAARSPICLSDSRRAVIPFCALERDFAEADGECSDTETRRSGELALHYVGAGPMMRKSFSLICQTLSYLRSRGDDLAQRVRIRLFGTGVTGQRTGITPLVAAACEFGIGDLVEEQPERIPYRRALELVLKGDGLLILGVDDAGYVPSKLISYALSGKPLLASLRKDGAAYNQLQASPQLGFSLWFDATGPMPLKDAATIMRHFLKEVADRTRFDRRGMLKGYLGPAMARRHVEIFEACLASQKKCAVDGAA